MIIRIIRHLLFLVLVLQINAQDKPAVISKFGDPKAGFQFDFLREVVTGDQWKDAWETEVKVPLIMQEKFDGGLALDSVTFSPFGYSGYFTSGNKNKFQFRVLYGKVDIEPDQNNYQVFISDLTLDKKTSKFPYAVLIANYIFGVAGFDAPQAILASLRLSKDVIEEHPYLDDQPGFLFIRKNGEIPTTTNQLCSGQAPGHYDINRKKYLQKRLLDFLINNWNTNPLEECWTFSKADSSFSPKPDDFIFAFSRYEGLLPHSFTNLAPQWNNFDKFLPDIRSISWNGRFVDRKVLSFITPQEWQAATTELIMKLTDKVLFDAVEEIPDEIFNKYGISIFDALATRRNGLQKLSQEFYDYINSDPHVYGTEGKDTLIVDRDEKFTRVLLKTSNGYKLSRDFNNNHTEEIFVYLGNDDDLVHFQGTTTTGPIVRVIGQDGKDTYKDHSYYKGNWLGFMPIPAHRNKNYFYDSKETSVVKESPSTQFENKTPPNPEFEFSMFSPKRPERGLKFSVSPRLNYSRDDGIIWGARPHVTKYDFMKDPYDYDIGLSAIFFSRRGGYQLRLENTFNYAIPGATLEIDIEKSESVESKYYGYGNNTIYEERLFDDGVYNMNQELFSVDAVVTFQLNDFWGVGGRLRYKYLDSEPNKIMLNRYPGNNVGINGFKEAAAGLHFYFDNRDNDRFPEYGTRIYTHAEVFPAMLDNKNVFYKAGFELDSYYTYNFITNTTWNLKIGGKKLWNDFPFFEAVYLGGSETLPGYRSNRFSGDSFLYGTLKANFYITELFYLLKAKTGLLLVTGLGRVFSNNDINNLLHESYGIGLFLTSFNDTVKYEIIFATTPETRSAYFNTNLEL